MTVRLLKDTFESMFPYKPIKWQKAGDKSLYILLDNGVELVFTYNGKQKWRLETAKMFANNLKGEK